MKLSGYNLIIYKSPYSYWYNTFTKNFFRLSMELGEKVSARLEERRRRNRPARISHGQA